MSFSALLRFVISDRERPILPHLRQVLSLFIVLQLLSTAFVSPVTANANTEGKTSATSFHEFSFRDDLTNDEQFETYSNIADSGEDCGPAEGENRNDCDNTTTTNSRDCNPDDNRTSDKQRNTDGNGDGSSTAHSTTESSAKTSQKSEQTNTPGAGVLPDINSPIIAVLGLLCVIGGLVALTRQ